MRNRNFARVILLIASTPLIFTMFLWMNGCALMRKQNPQLPPNVALELNLADQLRQLERDYRTFFKDVGDAERSGQLTAEQVGKLNAIGHKLQPTIEHGNSAFKQWQANRADDSLKAAVMAAIQEGTALMLELTSQQRTMLKSNAKRSELSPPQWTICLTGQTCGGA